MGIRILHDGDTAAMYCSTSDWAFGPVFSGEGEHEATERADAFLRWIDLTPTWSSYEKHQSIAGRGTYRDVRQLTDAGLEHAYKDWRAQEAAQWAREQAEVEIAEAELD